MTRILYTYALQNDWAETRNAARIHVQWKIHNYPWSGPNAGRW